MPAEILELTRFARANVGGRLGIHTHDDIGLGVANAIASLDAGVSHIQGTLNGYGGEALIGNCSLTSSVMPFLDLQSCFLDAPPCRLSRSRN